MREKAIPFTLEKTTVTDAPCFIKEREKYYIVFWGRYDERIFATCTGAGLKEIADFVFKIPKPVTISGDCAFYEDARGNTIERMHPNIKFTLQGYGAKIVLKNTAFASGTVLVADSGALFTTGEKSRFGMDTRFEAFAGAEVCIGNSSFGNNLLLSCGAGGLLTIGNAGTFGSNDEIVCNCRCTLFIGDGVLVSRFVQIRAGDGHALFNVTTRTKRNFLVDDVAHNSTVIGNHVWLSYGVTVLNPCNIGSGCTVAAKSTAKGTYPNNTLIAGSIATVKKTDSAWAGNPLAEEMEAGCGNLYAIPTHKKTGNTSFEALCRETDFFAYIQRLCALKDVIGVIAVRNTLGFCLGDAEQAALKTLGVREDVRNKHWQPYLFVWTENGPEYEVLGAKDTAQETVLTVKRVNLSLASLPLNAGNKAVVRIADFDYSTNGRGLNIVMWDRKAAQLIDSVCFDTHAKAHTCTRKIYFP